MVRWLLRIAVILGVASLWKAVGLITSISGMGIALSVGVLACMLIDLAFPEVE